MMAGMLGHCHCSGSGQASLVAMCSTTTSSSVSSSECHYRKKFQKITVRKQRNYTQSLQATSVRGEGLSGVAKGDRSTGICEEMDAGVGLRMIDEEDRVPGHVAIIMDGNHRWAKERGLPGAEGHRQGVETLRRTVVYCVKRGIRALTVFAFSTENWRRGHNETGFLLRLMEDTLLDKVHELVANGVRLRFVGDVEEMSTSLVKTVEKSEKLTDSNSDLLLTVALNYSGRADIVSAAKRIAQRVEQGTVSAHDVNENLFAKELEAQRCFAGVGDPDLLIRTSGEKRLSNFLLWDSAYTELFFTDVYWPDFGEVDLMAAIAEFGRRNRRFGGR